MVRLTHLTIVSNVQRGSGQRSTQAESNVGFGNEVFHVLRKDAPNMRLRYTTVLTLLCLLFF